MKSTILSCLLLLGISTSYIQSQTVKIDKFPATIEEFLELRDNIAKTPEGGATIFLIALKIYTENVNLGKQCLVIAADRGSLKEGNVYKGFELLNGDMSLIDSQLGKDKNIPNSYIKGTSPADSYKVNPPYVFEFSSNAYSGDIQAGNFKLFVKCTGADSSRPISLKRNDKGLWKASNWSSLLVGVKKPAVDDGL